MNPLLHVREISKETLENFQVREISFSQSRMGKLAIMGETGSGKSTLLKMIAGLVQPDAGAIYFEEEKVIGPLDQLIPGHKHIAYLSQHYELRNNYVVFDYLDYGSEMTAAEGMDLYRLCEIDHLLQRKTNSGLSGGERQRIALAKILTKRPKLLLLDEPFSNLDALHKQTIKQVIHQIQQRFELSIVLVSHDAADILPWADEIMIMQSGSIVQHDTPEKIYHAPLNEYVAGLLGQYSIIDASLLKHFFPAHFEENAQAMVLRRPEHWRVSYKATDGVAVEVIKTEFFGSSYLLHVKLKETILLVRTSDRSISELPLVYISPV